MTRRHPGKRAAQRDFEQFAMSGTRCTGCGKIRFLTKADAKKTITRMKGRTGRMHPYRCETEAGTFWHIGHVPNAPKAGVVTRDDVEARRFA